MLNWLADIPNTQPIAQGVIVLCLGAASGLALGSIRIRGFSLGIAGTLFAGLFFAHFGFNVDPSFRAFIQEFGLVLFVYTIGLQVGPGFVASLRRQGLSLNLLAAGGDGGAVYDFGYRSGNRRRHFRRRHHQHPGLGGSPGGLADLT